MQQSKIAHSQVSLGNSLSSAAPHPTQLFSSFYRRYRGVVCTYLHSHHVPSHAIDDLVQEVFVTAYQKRDCLHAESAAFAWLAAIARYKVINYRRGNRRRDRKLNALAHEPMNMEDATRRPDQLVMQSLVRRYLGQLGRDRLEVLVYAEVYGLNSMEIAELSKVNPNTIRARLSAARRQLRSLALKIDRERVVEVERSLLTLAVEESGGGTKRTESSLASLLPLLMTGSLLPGSSTAGATAGGPATGPPTGLDSVSRGTEGREACSSPTASPAGSACPPGAGPAGEFLNPELGASELGTWIGQGVYSTVGTTIKTGTIAATGMISSSWRWAIGASASAVVSVTLLSAGGILESGKSDHPDKPQLEALSPRVGEAIRAAVPVSNELSRSNIESKDLDRKNLMPEVNGSKSNLHSNPVPTALDDSRPSIIKPEWKVVKNVHPKTNIRNRGRVLPGTFDPNKPRSKSNKNEPGSGRANSASSSELDDETRLEMDEKIKSKSDEANETKKSENSREEDKNSRELELLTQVQKYKIKKNWKSAKKYLNLYDREFASDGHFLDIRRRLGDDWARIGSER